MSDKKDNIVKKTCKELGITQKELADILKVNEVTVRNWSSKGNIPEMAQEFLKILIENKKLKEIAEKAKAVAKTLQEFQNM